MKNSFQAMPIIGDLKHIAASLCLTSSVISSVALANDNGPISYGVSQSIQYDSNIFRLSDGTEPHAGDRHRSDLISSSVLMVDFDQQIGRHVIAANLKHGFVRFLNYDNLNYQLEDYRVDWKGAYGSDSRYDVDLKRGSTLSNFADLGGSYRNVVTKNELNADLSQRVMSLWYAIGSVAMGQNANSASPERGSNNRYTSVDYGLRFDPRTGNWLEARARNARYDYPDAVAGLISDNTFTQRELIFSGGYTLSGATDIRGRISIVSREHEHLASRDFTGWQGELNCMWRRSDKSSMSVGIYRRIGGINDYSATYATAEGFRVTPAWTPTSKTRLSVDFDWYRRRYEGEGVVLLDRAAQNKRIETVQSYGLGFMYSPTRNSSVQVAMRSERRQGNSAALQYSDLSATLSGQIMF